MCNGNCAECTEQENCDCEKCGTDECRGKLPLYAAFRDGTTSTWKLKLIKNCPTCGKADTGFFCCSQKIGGCKCQPIERSGNDFYRVTQREVKEYGAQVLATNASTAWKASREPYQALLIALFATIGLFSPLFLTLFHMRTVLEWLQSKGILIMISLVVLFGGFVGKIFTDYLCYVGIIKIPPKPSSDPKDYLDQVKLEIEPCPF